MSKAKSAKSLVKGIKDFAVKKFDFKGKKSKLLAAGAGGGLATVGAGVWGLAGVLGPVASFLADMMQFAAIMNTQEMVTDLKEQVESLKYRSPEFTNQLVQTKKLLDNEQDSLSRSVVDTTNQLRSLGKVSTNIKVINGKPIDSIMYGLDVNIDDSTVNKYQLSGSDTQLMNSPNIGFNELAKATLNSKAEIINEIRSARNDSTKKLNRNARLISSSGKLAGASLKYSQEKLEGLDNKLDLMYESLAGGSQSGLIGSSAIADLMDSEKEEPKQKSLAEKLGEMYANITTIPERLAMFGVKTALTVLAAGSAIKLIADLIGNKNGGDEPAGLDWLATESALKEFELRESGMNEEDIREQVNAGRENLRWQQANESLGSNASIYNYVNDRNGRYYESKSADGSVSKVFLDNQTLTQLGNYYNNEGFHQLTNKENGYVGSVYPIAKLICTFFVLYSPKSLPARTQACITCNMVPANVKSILNEITAADDNAKLSEFLKRHTDTFAQRVFKPTICYAAKTLAELMCYSAADGTSGNLVYYDKNIKKFVQTSLSNFVKDEKQKRILPIKLTKLIIKVLLGEANGPEGCYSRVDLYPKESAEIVADRSSTAKEVERYLAKTGVRALEGVGKGMSGKICTGLGLGLDLGTSEALGGDSIARELGTGLDLAKEVPIMIVNKHPAIGVIIGTLEYFTDIGIDLYKAAATMDYYCGIVNAYDLGKTEAGNYRLVRKINGEDVPVNIFDYYLTGNASSALLSRVLLFYKQCCKSYMSSYNAAYKAKGEDLLKKGEVEFKNGFYYKKGTNDLMNFSLNDESDAKRFNYDIANSNSFLNNFSRLSNNNEDLYKAGDKEGNMYTGGVAESLGGVRQFTANLQDAFRAGTGEKLNLTSVNMFDPQGNPAGMAAYVSGYKHAFNMDDSPGGVLTTSLYSGMNKYIRDKLGPEKYNPEKHTVKVTYSSGARDRNPHNPSSLKDVGWGSHHKYGLAVDIGNLGDVTSKFGKKNDHTSFKELSEMVNYINKELEANGAGYYKVVLEKNVGSDGKYFDKYHLHIINGRPFINGELPKLPNEQFVKHFKANFLNNREEGYNWTRFRNQTNGKDVYYDESNIGMSSSIRDRLLSADTSSYQSANDIGDPLETIGNVDNKLNDLAKLVTATSMKVDASNDLLTEVFAAVGSNDSKITSLAMNSNKSVIPPGSELVGTDSRSL